MRWRTLAATSTLVGTFGAACASLVGVQDLPGPSASSDAGSDTAPTYAVPACASCVADACRELELACRADKTCANAYRALAACGLDEVKCRYDAERTLANDGSTQRYLALDACRRTSCLPECLGSKGLVYAIGTACRDCVDNGCAVAELACMRSVEPRVTSPDGGAPASDADAGASGAVGDCERHIACLQAVDPPNPDNTLFCNERFNEPEYGHLVSCVSSATCTSCPIPSYQCVDRYRWALPKGATARLSIATRDVNGAIVPATVRACSTLLCGNCTKENALAEVHIDDTADLTLPLGGGFGFVGCFRAIPDDAAKFSETLQSYNRPITRDESLDIVLGKFSELDYLRVNATHSLDAKPDTSIVTFVNRDCLYEQPPGLTTELAGSQVYYFDLATGLTSPTAKQTDGSGGGVYFDVPYGTHEVVSKLGDVVVTKTTVTVSKGAVTFAVLYPNAAK